MCVFERVCVCGWRRETGRNQKYFGVCGHVASLFYVAVFISVLYYDISYINITSWQAEINSGKALFMLFCAAEYFGISFLTA